MTLRGCGIDKLPFAIDNGRTKALEAILVPKTNSSIHLTNGLSYLILSSSMQHTFFRII